MLRGLRLPQRSFTRSFYTSNAALAFKKSSDPQAGKQRMQTPRKGSSEYRAFREAAPYSKYHESAPEIPADKLALTVPSSESLAALKSGTLVTWPAEVQAQLTHLGSFRPHQHNELFRTHSSLIRGPTEALYAEHLKPGKSLLITGDAGVGKSSLLSQAHAAAKLQGWAVVHIAQARTLVDGSLDAVRNKNTGVWDQPMFMGRLWKKTLKANRSLMKDVSGDKRTLKSLIDALSSSTKVLLTVDDVNAWSASPYAANTNEENRRIYHGDLEVPSTVLREISTPGSNVCVIAATSGDFKPIPFEGHAYARLDEFDPKLAGALSAASLLDLGRLNREETEAFVEYLKYSQIPSTDWKERFQVSGNGNPREILRSSVNFAF